MENQISLLKTLIDKICCLITAIGDTTSNTPANSHVVLGCVEEGGETVNGFTIVDDEGNPKFAPKPLSELGFTDCC